MKKQILLFAVIFGSLSLSANAQVSLSVNINAQPVWGPVGYDHADFYYLPDIETYYNVPRHEYTYFDGARWVTTPALPPRYDHYDLYHGYKVVLNEPTPWLHHDRYKAQYAQFRGRHDQALIRDSHDARYYGNPGHPEYNHWKEQHHDDHRDEGHDHGHDDHGRDR
jgi:hypothetical protein